MARPNYGFGDNFDPADFRYHRSNRQQTSKKQGADYMRQGKKPIGKMFGNITPKRAAVVCTTTALLVIAATPWVTIVHPPTSSLVASSIIWGSFWGWVISVIQPIWFFGPKIAVVIEQLFIRNVAYFITCVLYVVLNLTEAGVIFKNPWIRVFAYAVDISILYMFSPFYGTSVGDLFLEFPTLEWESLNVGLLLLFVANVFSFEICYQVSKKSFG